MSGTGALIGGVRLPQRRVWVNGLLCAPGEAVLSLFDRGARDGEGLFETLRVYAGRPFQWERHLERLVLSAAELGFPVPPSPSTLRAALEEVLAAEGLTDAVARLTVTRGVPGGRPTRTGGWVEAEPITGRLWARGAGATAMFSGAAFEPGAIGRHKTTSRLAYSLAREEARAARADEALLVSAGGEVLEGAVTNVFAVLRGEVVTPPLSRGILPGIARATALRLCAELEIGARERSLMRAELLEADEAFLTNSVQEIVPLRAIAGRALPSRAIGEALALAYRALVDQASG